MGMIILSSFVFAILSIILFWGKSLAFNFTVFSLTFIINLLFIIRKNGKIRNKKAYVLIIPIIVLSLGYTIFNNYYLNHLNLMLIPVLDLIMVFTLMGDKLNYRNTTYQILYLIVETLSDISESLGKMFDYIKAKFWGEKKDKKNNSHIIKGSIVTIFVVLLIIGLLSSADKNFASIFTNIFIEILRIIFEANIWSLILKFILGFCIFAYLLSFYYYLIYKFETDNFVKETVDEKGDATTIKMVLVALNLVYLLFVAVQINTVVKFTGESANFANYAREGFFQLMLVSFINIVTILIAKNKEKKDSKNLYVKVNSIIMLVFTLILIILSYFRMHEYVNEFGLTFLRISVYFALISEAIIVIPTGMYILKKKINLNIIYFSVFLATYVAFNMVNVNYVIAVHNVNKLENAGKIDINYLEELGENTSTQLIRALSSEFLDNNQKHDIAVNLSDFVYRYENGFDIREFNISKTNAYNKIKSSNYEEYILKDKENTQDKYQEFETSTTELQNPYTSDSPIVDNDALVTSTFDFELGNKYSKEECNRIALDYIQDIAKNSNVEWVKNWYSRYTVVYESKPVIEVHPNNYWELIRDGVLAPDVNMKRESWTEGAYEVTLVRYDDEVQMDRALVYVNPKTGKVSAGYEMGD